MLGSVQAITDDGALVAVSYAGSQIGPLRLRGRARDLVVGSQKIVADLGRGARAGRASTCNPTEDADLRAQLGVPTRLAKLLVVFEGARLGRTTVVLVREPVGV